MHHSHIVSIKPKLLFVSPEPAWLGRHGGQLRMTAMIELLSERYQVFKFAVGKNFGEYSPPQDWSYANHDLDDAIRNPNFHQRLIEFVKQNNIKLAYFNYYYFAPMAHALPEDVTTICDIHDVQHLRARSFATIGETPPNMVTEEQELSALKAFDRLVSINSNETTYLESKLSMPIITIPHIAKFRELAFRRNRYPLVVGSMAKPNQDGFRHLLLPAVERQLLPTPVLLAGGISPLASEDKSGRIIPMGAFESPVEIYPYASVALAPLRIGAGLKIKVIEALVHGVAVAGTRCAFDSIPELPKEIFFNFESCDELAGLGDFIRQIDHSMIREFAEAHYAPERYVDAIESLISS